MNANAGKTAARILVGNKCDLVDDREVSREEAEKLAKEQGLRYHETSAKTNTGLEEAFSDVFE